MNTTVFVEGMTCDHCVARVTNALSKVSGVKQVKVDLKTNKASLKAENPSEADLRQAVEDAGYVVKAIERA